MFNIKKKQMRMESKNHASRKPIFGITHTHKKLINDAHAQIKFSKQNQTYIITFDRMICCCMIQI